MTNIQIFADGANLTEMLSLYRNSQPQISGFTTNPTLMRSAGVNDYQCFAQEVLGHIQDLPISFEVFVDDMAGMERQARTIASWGSNVYVKIPVTNCKGDPMIPLIRKLSEAGIKLNITAVFTLSQVKGIVESLCRQTPSVISIFAGRVANAGVDPMPIMRGAVEIAKTLPQCQILWASPREALNVVQAQECGCHIITVTSEIMRAMQNFGKDLNLFSLETVQMFYRDAHAASYSI